MRWVGWGGVGGGEVSFAVCMYAIATLLGLYTSAHCCSVWYYDYSDEYNK